MGTRPPPGNEPPPSEWVRIGPADVPEPRNLPTARPPEEVPPPPPPPAAPPSPAARPVSDPAPPFAGFGGSPPVAGTTPTVAVAPVVAICVLVFGLACLAVIAAVGGAPPTETADGPASVAAPSEASASAPDTGGGQAGTAPPGRDRSAAEATKPTDATKAAEGTRASGPAKAGGAKRTGGGARGLVVKLAAGSDARAVSVKCPSGRVSRARFVDGVAAVDDLGTGECALSFLGKQKSTYAPVRAGESLTCSLEGGRARCR